MTQSGDGSGPPAAFAAFFVAERQIALLDRCTPENAREERVRLTRVFSSGAREASPLTRQARWVLSRAPAFDDVRCLLEAALSALRGDELYGAYADRYEELLLEAELVEARGTPRFRELALSRYPVAGEELTAASELAERWLSTAGSPPDPVSDRAPSPRAADLKVALRAKLAELGLDVPVIERPNLATSAAVGHSVVYVSPDAPREPEEVERIVLHEIEGHLLPRFRARTASCALLQMGARGAGEDEEGRALLLEERAGFWDESSPAGHARRRELALRHLAAVAVRQGAELDELMQLLMARGMQVPAAVRLAERVVRGGGLAREVAYLPAFLRVRRAFAAAPELEEWFRRGRVSVAAARALSAVA